MANHSRLTTHNQFQGASWLTKPEQQLRVRSVLSVLLRQSVLSLAVSAAGLVLEVRVEGAKAAASISGARKYASSAWRRLRRLTTRTFACWRSLWRRAGRLCHGG